MESKNDMSRTVSIVLNGKGGIGKSFIASCLQQAAMEISSHATDLSSCEESVLGFPRTRGDRPEHLDGEVSYEGFPPHPRG